MLDTPISGTGAQAAAGDIVLYVSGDEDLSQRCLGVFADFSRKAIYLGPFGAGTKMKFVANLLVAIHNVAAAEAVSLGLALWSRPRLALRGPVGGGRPVSDARGSRPNDGARRI